MRNWSAVVLASALAMAAGTGTAAGRDPGKPFAHLDPGGPVRLHEQLPVQVVFVGYDRSLVKEKPFLAALPNRAEPVIRSRQDYGVKEPVGLEYAFNYHVVFADASYADRFFGTLADMAVRQESVDGRTRTLYQDLYNRQAGNVLEVGQNFLLDAPTVEGWLTEHPPPGVNPERNTVVFVNWWGRADFRFHTYTKFGEPDPDTGYDFGRNRQSRHLIAWGGTAPDDEETGRPGPVHRLWFHDLSAGPDSWTAGWNVDDADFDADNKDDRRLPPVWEYLAAGGNRSRAELASDLARVTRYVAIDLLFAPSPLYPPYLTPHRLPASINLDVNTYRDRAPTLAGTPLRRDDVLAELRKLTPIPLSWDIQERLLRDDGEACFHQYRRDKPCYPQYAHYPGYADFFLYQAQHLDVRDGGGDYEVVVAGYITQAELDVSGMAEDNYADGTQSVVVLNLTPRGLADGRGLTATMTHEVGHHLGLSHTHDGYDSEEGRDFLARGDRFFVWVGDEVNSVMSYVDVNHDFSVFDRDHMYRWQATAYLRSTNAIAADVLHSPRAAAGLPALADADREAGATQAALSVHDYPAVFTHARAAYLHARRAAEDAAVAVPADVLTPWTLQPAGPEREYARTRPRYVDPIGPGDPRHAP
jgi:hypothetical protein